VFDASQSIDRISVFTNEILPAIATGSEFFYLCDGRILNPMQIGYLMGHSMTSLDLRGVSEGQLRHMLGMGFHLSSIGFCIVGLLASTA